ncbi:hypothetical protein B0H14DRAFT_2625899 [Mycena olivaceomarginata]|nr:hypothetical protein B0H14DRAFT_2625899 [Mycena olivaceomarginata]
MHHGHVLRRGVAFRQAPSSDSGCPPTDLGGSTLEDGNSNGPLALCLYSNGGHCTYLGGTVQANLSGNDADCPARLISGSDGESQSGILTLAAPPTQTSASASPPAQLNYKYFSHRHEQPRYVRSTHKSGQYREWRDFGNSLQHDVSLAGGVIAGIAIGTLALILLLLALLFCVRRRHRRILNPLIHVELAAESGPTLPSAASEKTPEDNAHLNGMAGQEKISRSTTSPSVPVQLRQEYLRNRIGEAQRKLLIMNDAVSRSAADDGVDEEITLEGALRQIQSQQEQIGRLESQLQSQWALGLSDEPPPQYLQ